MKLTIIIDLLLLIPFAAGTRSSAKQESSKLSSDAMRHLRAADFFSLSLPVNGAGVEGIAGASKTSVQTMRSAKSSKASFSHSGVCSKRLHEAYELGSQLPYFDIKEMEDVTKLCSFVTPTDEAPTYNQGCPFSFEPANVFGPGDPLTNFFPKGVKEYEELFQKLSQKFCDSSCDNLACVQSCLQNAAAEGEAVASVALYCSCYQGYDLGCSNKLPSTPQEKDEYCKFAGVWNGDFKSKEVKLSRETNDCGCFWISQVTDEVGNCPGVDLGYGYFERRF